MFPLRAECEGGLVDSELRPIFELPSHVPSTSEAGELIRSPNVWRMGVSEVFHSDRGLTLVIPLTTSVTRSDSRVGDDESIYNRLFLD